MKLFKFGGIFFMIITCFLLYSGIKGILSHIEYKQKSKLTTVYITKKKFYKKRKGSKNHSFYKGNYYYLINQDTIFEKNKTFKVYNLNKDTTQYYGTFERRYFPKTEKLYFNKHTYEHTRNGKHSRKLWTKITPLFIAIGFFFIGRVFYWIGKMDNK